jgi:predicted HicB family RNase H-like nuclease
MKRTRTQIKDAAKRYVKIVEWSEKDGVFVGSAPPLIGQACHGDSEEEVLAQLQTIVEEWVEILLSDKKPLPAELDKKTYSGRFVVRVKPELHKRLALQAAAREESLNEFIVSRLASS